MEEVELKFELGDIKMIFKDLISKSTHESSGYEISTMFDLDGLLDRQDARLRVRTIASLLDEKDKKVEFCYKKPITREGIKVELEHETLVEDNIALENILKEIGFEKTSSYERFRHIFRANEIKICFDVFPFTTFLEIEGKENEIVKFAEKLGFSMSNNLTDSCDTIDHNRRMAACLPPRDHILFEDLNKVKDEQIELIRFVSK